MTTRSLPARRPGRPSPRRRRAPRPILSRAACKILALLAGLVPLVGALILLLAPGADRPQAVPPEPVAPRPTAVVELREGRSTAAFLERLEHPMAGVGEAGGRLWWEVDGERFELAGVRLGRPVLATAVGPVEIAGDLAARPEPGTGPTLARLLAAAERAGLGADAGLVLEGDLLLGTHLASEEAIVLPEGVAHRQPVPDRRADLAIDHLRQAIDRFGRSLDRSELGAVARRAVLDVVARLPLRDAPAGLEELDGAFARKLVRQGWLTGLADLASNASAVAVERAVIEVMRLVPVVRYTGRDLHVVKSQDALGHVSWALSTPERSGYAVRAPLPAYHAGARRALATDGRLVVLLPPGVDPAVDADAFEQVIEARLHRDGALLVRWSASEGFEVDREAWRRVASPDGLSDPVADYLPPSLVLVDLHHDVRRLFTARGDLRPPADPSPAEAERFLTDAARALPDAAHLDLIGQYLFTYVHDSPDTSLPLLIGSPECAADIHQTSRQTLATVVGGVCRGDCDDLAELYVDLLERQGRLAHVLFLPGHAAAVWAERGPDGWRTRLLQTGPAHAYAAASLDDSLAALYRSFGATASFDGDALEFLVRFEGANTRVATGLPSAVLEDPALARTMIEVEADRRRGSYERAIERVETLLAASPSRPACFLQLADLCRLTGRIDRELEALAAALDRTDDPAARLRRALGLAEGLARGERDRESGALARRIVDEFLPAAIAVAEPVEVPTVHLEVARSLRRAGAGAVAVEILSGSLRPVTDRLADDIASGLADGSIAPDDWRRSPERELLAGTAELALELMATATGGEAGGLLETARPYHERLLLHSASGPAEVGPLYADLARFHGHRIGHDRLEERVAGAPFPSPGDCDHWRRSTGDRQLLRDLGWIRTSTAYWYDRMVAALAAGADDRRMVRLAGALEEAGAVAAGLGSFGPDDAFYLRLGGALGALAAGDGPRLRSALAEVGRQDDRALSEAVASIFGWLAACLGEDWFERSFAIWSESIGTAPLALSIAWTTGRQGAPDRALHIARSTAARYPGEASVARELAALERRFGRR